MNKNFIFENFVKLTEEQKAFFVKAIREHNLIDADARIVPVADYLKSVNRNYPALRDADISVKMDTVRTALQNRDAYNSILVTTVYKDESSLVKKMSNISIIINIRFGRDATEYEFLSKEEYLDAKECDVSYLQDYVPSDGSEMDIKLQQYEALARYMDLPDLYLRADNIMEEPDVYANFSTPYSFHTYDGDFDREAEWIEGKKSRKNLLKKTKSPYTKADVKTKFEYVEAVLQFIKEHPEEKDLFDDLDVAIDPETGEKRRMGLRIFDINPDWIGKDDEGNFIYAEPDSDEE